MIERIFSGGQTGVGRAALDWAISHDIPHGGWCPKGRQAEDGVIPVSYELRESPSASYIEYAEWNVRDSTGTVICSIASTLSGDNKRVVELAMKHGKPWIHLSASGSSGLEAKDNLSKFISKYKIRILNVAGSPASREPRVGVFVMRVLDSLR